MAAPLTVHAGVDPAIRAGWGPGPWQNEPDFWQGEAHGFIVQAIRHFTFGNLNGYLCVRPEHPWHGKTPEDLSGVETHWGLTYSARQPEGEGWVVGFDTAHAGDSWPGKLAAKEAALRLAGNPSQLREIHRKIEEIGYKDVYRDLGFVQSCLGELARKASAA